MTGRLAAGGRTAIVGVLVIGAITAVLIGWYRAGMREAAQQEAAMVEAARREQDDRAAEHADALADKLEALRHGESARPYFHYQNLFHDPAGASEGLAVVPSPLASGPADPLIAVHFQIDEGGAVSSPSVNDALPDAVQSIAPDRGGLAAVMAARVALAEVAEGAEVALAGGPQVAVATPRRPPVGTKRPVRTSPSVIEPPRQAAEPPAQVVALEPDVYAQNNFSNEIFAATKQNRALTNRSEGNRALGNEPGPDVQQRATPNPVPQRAMPNPVPQRAMPPALEQRMNPPPTQQQRATPNPVPQRVNPSAMPVQRVNPSQLAPPQAQAPPVQQVPPSPPASPSQQAPLVPPSPVPDIAPPPPGVGTATVSSTPRRRRREPEPPPEPPPPVIVTVSPLTWHTVSIAGEPTLVAVRRVVTPDGARTQGLTVGRAQLAEWLADRGDATATLGRDDVGAAIGLGGSPWKIQVDDPGALAYARSTGAMFRDGFLIRFVPIAAVAMLCGALVVLVTARSERLARQRARFAAAAAHELRTPLAGIQLYGDMLGEQLGDPTKQRDYASRISLEAARLGRVVANVLGVSQLERGGLTVRVEVADVVATVREAVERVEAGFARAGATLTLEAPASLVARFDRDAVARIVGNLLDNAEKYGRDAADRRITVTIATTGDGAAVEIAVRDRGPGLPAAMRRGRFEAFRRGAGDDAPPGLGLALSQALALAMDGALAPRAVSPGAALVLRVPAA